MKLRKGIRGGDWDGRVLLFTMLVKIFLIRTKFSELLNLVDIVSNSLWGVAQVDFITY